MLLYSFHDFQQILCSLVLSHKFNFFYLSVKKLLLLSVLKFEYYFKYTSINKLSFYYIYYYILICDKNFITCHYFFVKAIELLKKNLTSLDFKIKFLNIY